MSIGVVMPMPPAPPREKGVIRVSRDHQHSVGTKRVTRRADPEVRFKAVLVDSEDSRYLATLLEYVHLNPIRAGIIRLAEVHRLLDYPGAVCPDTSAPANVHHGYRWSVAWGR